MSKTCNDCQEIKSLEDFYKRKNTNCVSAYCKSCIKIRNKKIRDNDPELMSQYQKEYQKNNKEKIAQNVSEYYQNNKSKIKAWKRVYVQEKYKNDPMFKIKEILRFSVRRALKGLCRTETTQKILGCSYEKFRLHMEEKFIDGMTWENHGLNGWHIDHIIPLASAKNKDEALSLCHYTNLQPLWAFDNLSKGSKISSRNNEYQIGGYQDELSEE